MKIRRKFVKLLQLLVYLSFMFLYRIFFDFKISGSYNLTVKYDSFILEANHVSYLDPLAVSLKVPFLLTQCRFYEMIHVYTLIYL